MLSRKVMPIVEHMYKDYSMIGKKALYIGNIKAVDIFEKERITHVLSVIRDGGHLLWGDNKTAYIKMMAAVKQYKHLRIEVDDLRYENLLVSFGKTNDFINEGLEGGGGVFVHCWAGQSRSATCVLAYLMQKHKISPQEAFDEVRKYRRINTNQGFEKQLEVYHQMKCPTNVEEHPIYQDWLSSNGIEIQKWQEEMGPRPGWRLN